MSNTLGTLAPSLVTQKTLDYLKQYFPPVMRMFLNFTDKPVLLNQTITSRIPGATAAYDASGGYTAPDVTDVDVPVVVNKFKAASVKFTATQLSSTNRDLINEHAVALANSLGSGLVADLCALFLAANFPNATTMPAVNYDDETLRTIRKRLNIRKVSPFGRLGIVNSDVFDTLSGDPHFTTVLTNKDAQEVFTLNPTMMTARGFDIMEFAQLPTNGQNLNGIFLGSGALVGATGIPADSNAPGMWDAVPNVAAVTPKTDEDTGITLLQRLHKDKDGGIQMDLAWIYGFALGDGARAQRSLES